VVSFTPAGKIKWERHIVGGDSWTRVGFSEIKRLSTGGFVILGGQGRGEMGSIVVTKLSGDGQSVSQTVFEAEEFYGAGMDSGVSAGPAELLADGGVVEGGSIHHPDQRTEGRLVRSGPDGKKLWERQFPGNDSREVAAIRVLEDGSVLVGLQTDFSRPTMSSLALVSESGALRWKKPVNERAACSIKVIRVLPSGEIVAAGGTCDAVPNRVWVGKFTGEGDLMKFQTLIAWPGGADGYVRPLLLEPGLQAVLAVAARSPAKELWFLRRPLSLSD
jgi:hypothetical protein